MGVPVTPRAATTADDVAVTVLVPVKDEEAAIPTFVARVGAILDGLAATHGAAEMLFVDDGSTDGTLAAIRAARAVDGRVVALSLSRNFGKEAALSAGLDHARGACVVPIDVDLQDPPELIAPMMDLWRQGWDVVYGVRRRASDGIAKRLSAHWFYRVHNAMTRYKIPEHAGDFRLLDRAVVDVLTALPERNRFMKGLFNWAGFQQTAIAYDRVPRAEGTTKFRPWQLWSLAVDGITSATTLPLRIWSYLGGLLALASIVYAVFVVARTLIGGVDVPGYASLLVAVLFLGGVQLLSLGILGEYVGRIFTEVKRRPVYVVRRRVGLEGDD